jgi:hypothetical protein
MKKGLISLAACAALFAPSAFAGTVQTSTDNDISLYGEITYYSSWSGEKTDFLNANTAYNSDSNKTKYESYIGTTLLGIDINNKQAGIDGKIEGDFDADGNTFELTYAYVQHNLNNGLFVLVGKTDQIGEANTFSNNYNATAGFNGTDQVTQVRAGGSFDLGSVTLTPEIALEDIRDVLAGGDNDSEINRVAFPGIGAKLSAEFKTGFGEPARVYAFYEFQNLKIKNGNDEVSKTPYVFGAGFNIPVSIVQIQAEYLYGKGTTNYAGVAPTGDLKIPGGYYTDGNDLKARKFYAYNIEASISPIDILNVYSGYDYVRFKNHIDNVGDNIIKDSQTVFAGINLATTKYTTLSLEWDHYKTKYYPTANNSETASANQVFLMYDYAF